MNEGLNIWISLEHISDVAESGVTYTALTIRFHIQPWNGTLALLDVCSTSAGIPPRKTRCKGTGWSLARAASLLTSSSTWTASSLKNRWNAQLLMNWHIFYRKVTILTDTHTPTCQAASRCAASALCRHSAIPAPRVGWLDVDCGCRWTAEPPVNLCSAWRTGRAAGGEEEDQAFNPAPGEKGLDLWLTDMSTQTHCRHFVNL